MIMNMQLPARCLERLGLDRGSNFTYQVQKWVRVALGPHMIVCLADPDEAQPLLHFCEATTRMKLPLCL